MQEVNRFGWAISLAFWLPLPQDQRLQTAGFWVVPQHFDQKANLSVRIMPKLSCRPCFFCFAFKSVSLTRHTFEALKGLRFVVLTTLRLVLSLGWIFKGFPKLVSMLEHLGCLRHDRCEFFPFFLFPFTYFL